MPIIGLRSGFFDALEDSLSFPEVTLDYAYELETLAEGDTVDDPTVLQLSSSLIRFEVPMMSWSGDSIDYEFRLSGSGIGPVSSIRALFRAIDQGLAQGTISKFEILADNAAVFKITLGSAGYVFSSGDQSLTLSGHLPLSFTQLFDFVDLFTQANDIYSLTTAQRNALFDDLSHYGISGLSVADGGTELFGFDISSTMASLSLNGMTLTARGTFPDNFGEDLELLWQMTNQLDDTGTIDFSSIDNLAMTSLKITDQAGHVLGTIFNPLNGSDPVWRVDTRFYDEVRMDMTGANVMVGEKGAVRSVLAGLDGNDRLFGGGANDLLLGGTDNDTLNGGTGFDRLNGGAGRDQLSGGGQADTFVFLPGAGTDTILDFVEGVDKIEIRTADDLTDLRFTDLGANVRIDFNSIHIIVTDIEIGELAVLPNFVF